ncbi:unnamed protein product, partial [Thlaspi arvense]
MDEDIQEYRDEENEDTTSIAEGENVVLLKNSTDEVSLRSPHAVTDKWVSCSTTSVSSGEVIDNVKRRPPPLEGQNVGLLKNRMDKVLSSPDAAADTWVEAKKCSQHSEDDIGSIFPFSFAGHISMTRANTYIEGLYI